MQPSPTLNVEQSLLPGVKVLLEGPTGTGKTYSIGTLTDTGLDLFYLGLESGMESLLGYWTDRGKPVPDNLKWHSLKQSEGGLENLFKGAEQIGSLTQDSLYKVQDFERAKNNRFKEVLAVLSNFKDQRTGQEFGSVHKWGPNKALVIDGLTGLGVAAMNMVVGNKPVRSQTDWGISMDQVEKILRMLCDYSMHFVLLGHIERETDLVQGGSKITVSTLGVKLAPKIPPLFSDVVLAQRNGTVWTWSTASPQADLKSRNLGIADNLPPSFKPIIDKWLSRGGRMSAEVKK
jgi:hypothetical protein